MTPYTTQYKEIITPEIFLVLLAIGNKNFHKKRGKVLGMDRVKSRVQRTIL